MKVSVIIPVYNIERYIGECAESLLSQEYEDMEFIFVDDCSTDQSMEILQQTIDNFPEKKHRVTILRHQFNRGLSAARNTGTDRAEGDYVIYVDGDDIMAADAMDRFVRTASRHHEPSMVMGNFRTFGERDPWDGKYKCKAVELNDNNSIFKACRNDVINTMAWNKLVKRDFLLKNRISFPEGIIHEDIVWNVWICNHLDAFVSFSEITYRYRIRPHSLTTDKDAVKQTDGIISYLEAWNRLFHTASIPRDGRNVEFFNAQKFIELKKISRNQHLDLKMKAHYISRIFRLDYAGNSLLKLSKRFWWKTPIYLYLWIKAKTGKSRG